MSAVPGQRSIVLISPGFLVTATYQYDLSEVIDKATRANVFINTLDGRGLYTVDAIGDISRPTPRFSNSNAAAQDALYRSQEQSIQSDVLANLSGSTGGFYFRNNNDLVAGFRMTAGGA